MKIKSEIDKGDKKIMKKSVFSIILLLSIVFVALPYMVVTAENDTINNDASGMPDKELYQVVLKALGKKSDQTFTKTEVAKLTGLYAGLNVNDEDKRGKIKDLKGMEYFTNLKELTLYHNSITSLSQLSNLKNLEMLTVEDNQISNLKGIENLTKLTELDVSFNKLESISEVKNLKNLTILRVQFNNLNSLSGVENLTKLISLTAENNQLTSIKPVKDLTQLTHLRLPWNKLTNINHVSKLTKLEGLDVAHNKLKELPNLTKHTHLWPSSCNFTFNKLSVNEIKTKFPKVLLSGVDDPYWLAFQKKYQNLSNSVKLDKSVNVITTKTKKITGKALSNVSVKLVSGEETIKTVQSNDKGEFSFLNLNLEEYKDKTLKVQAFGKVNDFEWTSNAVSRKVK